MNGSMRRKDGEITVNDAEGILALLLTPGMGTSAVRHTLAALREARLELKAVVGLRPADLIAALPEGSGPLASLLAKCTEDHVRRASYLLAQAEKRGAHPLCITHETYPRSILGLLGSAAPPLLFVLGARELLDGAAASVVGTREPTPEGAALARRVSGCLTNLGIPVVSGGADGVDTCAHESALESGGRTLVVLPSGLLRYAPPPAIEHALRTGRAALVSPYPPDQEWCRYGAVQRNALTVAFGQMTCVIEPRKQGGSIRAARYALEYRMRLLVHIPEAESTLASTLTHAGALPLLDEQGRFDPARIRALWESRPAPGPGQGELF